MFGLHDDGGVFRAEEEAGIVDAGDEVEILLLHVRDGAGADDACVREHQVKPAELFNRLCDHVRNGFLVGDVDRNGDGALAHFLCDLLCQRLIHIGDNDGRAFLVQLLRNALAEALGRAGHDADLAAETALARRALAHVGLCDLAPFGHINRHKSTLFLEVYLYYTCICMLIQERSVLFFWFVARFPQNQDAQHDHAGHQKDPGHALTHDGQRL